MKAKNDVWPIKIYTLGRFSIINHGEPIHFSSKIQRKPIELLKIVLALGGREVSITQVSDVLWPDSDGDLAHNALGVTLYRLRKLLGEHNAVRMYDNKLTLDPQTCWVDVWEFERLLGMLETLLKTQHANPQEINMQTEGLLNLCHGAFLKGETDSAVFATRERVHNKFLQLIEITGQYWEQAGDWQLAKECYQKGLEAEPMQESLYQRLMICHREMGQRAEALIVYQRCHDTLSTLLSIPPSQHTEAIRRSLI